METHPRAQLSAYLDGALAPADRTAIDAHLDTCADCRARLAELRAVASLISALPALSPSRRLVPRVAPLPVWMAPVRTLTTFASGLAAFMFIASALLSNVTLLSSSAGTAAGPAVAPAASGAGTAERNTATTLASATPDSSARPGAAADGATKAAGSSAPTSSGSQFQISTTPPQDAAARSDQAPAREPLKPQVPLVSWSPWLWLGLALVLGAIAFALQRRLRSA